MAAQTTRSLISEIVLRSVANVLPNTSPKDIEAVADGLITMIEGLVVGVRENAVIHADSFRTFVIWNEILDRVEKEIPVINDKIIVNGQVTRQQRKDFLNAAATPDSDRTGEVKDLDA